MVNNEKNRNIIGRESRPPKRVLIKKCLSLILDLPMFSLPLLPVTYGTLYVIFRPWGTGVEITLIIPGKQIEIAKKASALYR